MSSIPGDQRTVVQVLTARMLERPPRALDIQEIAEAMRHDQQSPEQDPRAEAGRPRVDVRA